MCVILSQKFYNLIPNLPRTARTDSPASLSKSCSDKLALKQCTSVLSSLTALLILPENAYLTTLVLPRHGLHPVACERAFAAAGRMKLIVHARWPDGFAFRPFNAIPSDVDFGFSRTAGMKRGKVLKGSNVSAMWTPRVQQTLINGVLQGRRQDDPQGASSICRRRMWETFRRLAIQLYDTELMELAQKGEYIEVKSHMTLHDRRNLKAAAIEEALQGWTPNEGDNTFGIDITV